VLLGAAPAQAIDFNFQFQDVDGGTNGFVTGTLSGLVEGNNSGTGITATVTSSPGGEGIGSGYNFDSARGGGNAFTVTSGNITFANALFINPANTGLYLGTPGSSGWSNNLCDRAGDSFDYFDSSNTTIQFTPATPVPFEPNSVVGIATLGFCFGAAKVRKNQLAKKRMVSVEA
jgi:hypothetical protein